MNHLDLFSGIGGFSLAASWVWGEDHNIVSFVEIDKFCQKVLAKHWPNVPCHDDIRTYKHNGTNVDLLTGGFPCQPFSCAGKRAGSEDDRHLWPQMLRVIRAVRPTYIIGENVAGIINMELDQVLSDLEDSEYEVQPFLIPACGVDAPHRKKIGRHCEYSGTMADTTGTRLQEWRSSQVGRYEQKSKPKRCGCEQGKPTYWLPEPNMGRVAYGVRNRVDRLKLLGNAIVPQVVVPIMECIKSIEEN